jgi:hypothetical protein
MKGSLALILVLSAPFAFCQTESVTLKVSSSKSASGRKTGLESVKAIFPNKQADKHEAIKIYSNSESFTLRNRSGRLVWFSFTRPGIRGARVSIEADQAVFGALLYDQTLYVCAPESAQASLPVINKLLFSEVDPKPLTQAESLTVALLTAKCSNTLQVYGDPHASLGSAQDRMQGVAAPPVVSVTAMGTQVVFYAWSALPVGEISRWTMAFGPNNLAKVESISVAKTGPQ